MPAQVALLRGINIGPNNRIAMPALRELCATGGLGEARTYLQSGNVVLTSRLSPAKLAAKVEKLIADELSLDIAVIVRTRDELAAVVAANPLGDVATEPKRYQVSFLEEELDAGAIARIAEAAVEPELAVVQGREIYAWHPDGVGRSKLWARLAAKGLGVRATARNWTTVTSLLAMADGEA
jgi:uncharacterized protein (DUF1697 family)